MTHKTREIVNAAKFLYWDRWETVKKEWVEKTLEPHHQLHKTTNLLSSALAILKDIEEKSKSDERLTLVLIAAAVDPIQ